MRQVAKIQGIDIAYLRYDSVEQVRPGDAVVMEGGGGSGG